MNAYYDVIIIGGGIMGLLSAHEISKTNKTVLVIEKSRIGGESAASAGLTRSLRNDYEDPRYARLARIAWDKWQLLGTTLGTELVDQCGCLNIAERPGQYAHRAATWLRRDKNALREFTDAAALRASYPTFDSIHYGVLDQSAGLGFARQSLIAVRDLLLAGSQTDIIPYCLVESIDEGIVRTNRGSYKGGKIVIAAGLGTSTLLTQLRGSAYRLRLTATRPAQCMYYQPADSTLYDSRRLPPFAYLDYGIYGHPIVNGLTNSVKIGLYTPPGIVNKVSQVQYTIEAFVERYLPELQRTAVDIRPVTDTDQCSYDLTADENFVIGLVPNMPRVILAAGFGGTGYKFAPVVAEIMADLVDDRVTRYDISAFDPARFCTNSGRITYNRG